MYELVICTSDGKTLKRFDLSRAETARKRIVIGRAEDCDVRITSPAISRHHCAIEPDQDGDEDWIIRDLGSTYGVEMEGVKIAQADIKDGLEVRIGPALLKFRAASARVAAEIAREVGEGQ
jgi:pSer/pThr/pTyr-binding forkhead associated (FHA) protein